MNQYSAGNSSVSWSLFDSELKFDIHIRCLAGQCFTIYGSFVRYIEHCYIRKVTHPCFHSDRLFQQHPQRCERCASSTTSVSYERCGRPDNLEEVVWANNVNYLREPALAYPWHTGPYSSCTCSYTRVYDSAPIYLSEYVVQHSVHKNYLSSNAQVLQIRPAWTIRVEMGSGYPMWVDLIRLDVEAFRQPVSAAPTVCCVCWRNAICSRG